MLLKFDEMEEVVIPNFKGGEKYIRAKMFNDGNVRILYGILEPGASIGMHEHVDDSEEVYCISGEATVYIDDDMEILKPGMGHYCPKGHKHSMKNEGTENLVIFAAVPMQ